jgi:hypothetical protein
VHLNTIHMYVHVCQEDSEERPTPAETLRRPENRNCFDGRSAARHVSKFYDPFLPPIRLRTVQFSILAKLKPLGPLTVNARARDRVMDDKRSDALCCRWSGTDHGSSQFYPTVTRRRASRRSVVTREQTSTAQSLNRPTTNRIDGSNTPWHAHITRTVSFCMNLAPFRLRGNQRDHLLPGLRSTGFERQAGQRSRAVAIIR